MIKLAVSLLLFASAPLAALAGPVSNLVGNGSFEADPMANGSWNISSKLSGWTGGSAGIELRDNVAGIASDGTNFVELDTTSNSSMSQTVSTLLGQWYLLTFDFSNRPGTPATSNGLAWSFGSTSGIADPQAAITGSSNQWQRMSIWVQAKGSSTTLSFSATGTSDGYGSSLDNVSLSVPEPRSIALVLAALGAAVLVTKRKRRDRVQPR